MPMLEDIAHRPVRIEPELLKTLGKNGGTNPAIEQAPGYWHSPARNRKETTHADVPVVIDDAAVIGGIAILIATRTFRAAPPWLAS